jgi:hypothetical protein
MASSEGSEYTPEEQGAIAARLDLEVDGEWSVAELESLLHSVRQIYEATLVAKLSRPAVERSGFTYRLPEIRLEVEREEPVERRLEAGVGTGAAAEELPSLFFTRRVEPEASPFHVSASKPPAGQFDATAAIKDHLDTIAPSAQLRIRKISIASKGIVSLEGSGEPIKEVGKLLERLTLLNQKREAAKIANERARQENKAHAIKDELAIVREMIQTLEEYLQLRLGDDFRSYPEAQKLIDDVLSGGMTISELMGTKHLRLLPPPEEEAAA